MFRTELRPNNSNSPKGMRIFFAMLLVMFVPTGLVFAFLGAWPVLGFVLCILLLFYYALYLSWRRNNVVEHISISPSVFTIEQTDYRGLKKIRDFPPQWLRVEVVRSSRRHSRLILRSHGKTMSFGQFLTPDEHLEVASLLDQELRSVQQI